MSQEVFRSSHSNFLSSGPSDLWERFEAADWDADKALRSNTVLLRDEQLRLDNVIIKTFKDRLRVAARLISLGLVYRVDNPWRVSEIEYNKADDGIGHGVVRSMIPLPRLDSEKPEVTPERVPVYYTLSGWMLDRRELETSRNKGTNLDTSILERKVRAMAEDIEDAVINGGTPKISGNQAKGLLDSPSLTTLGIGLAWDDPSISGTQILTDLTDAIEEARQQNIYGPFDLVVPPTWYNALQFDFKAALATTILQRLQAVQAGGESVFIYPADKMPTDTAILYPRDQTTVRLIVGSLGGQSAPQPNDDRTPTVVPISVFPWDENGGMIHKWMLGAVIIPNMRDTSIGQTGIIKITPEES